MSSYQYRKSHCGDKTVVRSSYLHNGISYTGKMSSLYWIGALISSIEYFLRKYIFYLVIETLRKSHFCSFFYSNYSIKKQFCTSHYSSAVGTCVKLWPYGIFICHIRVTGIFFLQNLSYEPVHLLLDGSSSSALPRESHVLAPTELLRWWILVLLEILIQRIQICLQLSWIQFFMVTNRVSLL